MSQLPSIVSGNLLRSLRIPPANTLVNRGKKIEPHEAANITKEFARLMLRGSTKKNAIAALTDKYGRGYWSIHNIVDGSTNKSPDAYQSENSQMQLLEPTAEYQGAAE